MLKIDKKISKITHIQTSMIHTKIKRCSQHSRGMFTDNKRRFSTKIYNLMTMNSVPTLLLTKISQDFSRTVKTFFQDLIKARQRLNIKTNSRNCKVFHRKPIRLEVL